MPADFPMCDWTPLQYLWDKGAAVVMMMLVVLLAVMRFVFVRVVVYGIQTSFRRTRCQCCDATPIKYRVNEKDPEFLEEWELSMAKTDLEQEAFESSDEVEMEEEEDDGLTREERIRKNYFKFDVIQATPNPWTGASTQELKEVEQKDGEPKYE